MKKILILFFAILFFAQFLYAQEIFFQTGHTSGITEVRFSPDDFQLISYSFNDGNLILWDIKSGRKIWTRETGFIRKDKEKIDLEDFYWSTDRKTLVTKSVNGTYQTWDALTGEILALTETKPEIELTVPDKKTVNYIRDYENTIITDSESGATKQFETYGIGNGFDTSNDGEMFAEGGGGYGDEYIKITNIKNEKTWRLEAHPGIIKEMKFSPDGKVLAVAGSDNNIYVFDAQKHNLIKTLTGHQKPVEKIQFSSDGRLLISSAGFVAVNIWNWQSAEIIKTNKSYDWLRFSSSIIPLDAAANQIITQYDSLSFEIRNTNNWEVLREFKTKEGYEEKSIRSTYTYKSVPGSIIKISKDGKKVFANYLDGKIRVWDINSAKLIREIKADSKNCQIKILPDEKSFLSFCQGKDKEKIKQIDLATGKVLRIYADEEGEDDDIYFTTQFVNTIELSPNGKYFFTASSSSDGLLWSIDKAKPIREFDTDFTYRNVIAFNPDGKTFAVVGADENTFLFDVETGNKLWQLIPSYKPSELEIQLEEKKP